RYVLGDVALTFPLFGWARQLRQSGKKAAMVIPFPHGTDFGFMNQPTRSARRILRSMIRCLQGEKHIGTKRAGTQRLGRMAVGGWSSGTDTLFSWIKGTITDDAPLSKSVREIYFFDGKEPTRAALTVPGPAKSWFKDDRRLRLIGTANTEVQSILLAKNLANDSILEDELAAGNSSPSAPVLAIPGRDDHWFKNALYIQALAPKPGSSKPLAMKLRPPGSPLSNPPRDVTDSSNVFLVSETRTGGPAKTGVVLMSPNGGPSQPVATVSQEEAAYFLNFFILPGLTNGGPITSEAQFTEAIRVMKETGDPREKVRIFQHRHAWSVIGGLTGFKGRSGFTGHLQICLELSGFK
ncbi:MAG: hypothetical protein ABI036_19030, partial [Fibrobacteria bacterium]